MIRTPMNPTNGLANVEDEGNIMQKLNVKPMRMPAI
jgi:hypothetical protein